ncbi:MAG: YheC/YheD family protein [Candidatus Micrarchaeota archaeon]
MKLRNAENLPFTGKPKGFTLKRSDDETATDAVTLSFTVDRTLDGKRHYDKHGFRRPIEYNEYNYDAADAQKHEWRLDNSRPISPKFRDFFITQVIPLALRHGGAFIKDPEGGGGGNITRIGVRNGFLTLQTTNKALRENIKEMLQEMAITRRLKDSPNYCITYLPGFIPSRRQLRIERLAALRAPLVFGRADAVDERTLTGVTNAIACLAANPPQLRLLIAPEIRHLKLGRRPLEIRLLVQRRGNRYAVTGHYAKVGGTTIASNIGQGGRILPSQAALSQAITQFNPMITAEKASKEAVVFLREAESLAETLFNKELEINHAPTYTYGSADCREFIQPPILSTVDVVAEPQDGRINPVVMEWHATGRFGLKDDARNGDIPPEHWNRMIAIHSRNIDRLFRSALRALPEKPGR